MRFFFDESGDFGFGDAKYDCYVLAGLICPDSVLSRVEAVVERLKKRFEVDELHATKMSDEQRLAFAIGLSKLDVRFVAFATDNDLDSAESIQAFRFAQAGKYQKGLDDYVVGTKALGKTSDPKIAEFTDRAVKRVGFSSRVSDSEIVQTHYTLELIEQALQSSLITFMEDRWRPDFAEMRFEIDAKLESKLSSGEKMLEEVLFPSLGSRPHQSMIVVDTWQGDPPHPFIQRYETPNVRVGGVAADAGFDLRKIFEHGLTFIDSSESAGVQAADLIAHSLRRAVLEPNDRNARLIAERLMPLSFNVNDSAIGAQVVRLGPSADDDQDLSRFRPIARSRRTQASR